ncbi:MAG: molecular chaperone DnaJ [Bdellovibrio sp.]|nr:molecular chaperone DnaJ [Bdellovibrio sp.]
MAQKRDYYDILGVSKSSSKEEVKKAYRKIAMQCHPDRKPGDKAAEAQFKEASEAAEVLLDDKKRTQYDQFGHAGLGAGGPGGFGGQWSAEGFGDLGDIFGDIFGDILGGGRRRGGRRAQQGRPGNDLEMSLKITFAEAAFGVEKNISVYRHTVCLSCHGSGGRDGARPTNCNMCGGAGEVRRQQGFFTIATTCPKCQGSGQMVSDPCSVCHGAGLTKKKSELSVKVPAGIDHGQRLKLSNEGDSGQNGGPNGDLYVNIEVEEHEFFERDGFDVYCTVPVSFSQAALGAEIEVPTLVGKVALRIPPGTQSSKKMRLKGKGIQRLGGSGLGDQIIQIHVETPTKLSNEQRELFQQMAALENTSNGPLTRGFFERMRDFFQ